MLFFFLFFFPAAGEHLVDQEALLDVPSLIHFYKYPVEVHDLVTKDGYILQLHRIPHGRDPREAPFSNGIRPVVLLMHGLFGDSSNSVMNPPTTSPGYVLADAGFDVWLGNCRGNAYSRRHSDPDHHQNDYWNFTWYDHAHIDLPDTVDYILDYTGERSIYYVGHSQGTIIMFAKLAEDNGEFAKKIRQFFALGPVGGFASTVGLMNVLGSQTIYDIIDHILGRKLHPFELPDFSRKGLTRFCNQPVFGYFLCQSFMAMFDGLQKNSQFNTSRIALYLEHFPSSTSTLNIIHWLQLIHTHQLRKMDYGPEGNREVYGTEEPSRFNLSSITTPTYLYFSDDDKITTIDSTRHYLLEKYGPGLKGYYDLDHFTHLDFAIGLRAVDEVYRPIVRTIYEDLERRNRFRSY